MNPLASLRPTRQQAFDLFFEGDKMLCDATSAGILVDVDYFREQQDKLKEETDELKTKILDTEEVKQYRKKFLCAPSFNKNGDIGKLVFDVLGYPVKYRTGKTNAPSTKEKHLLETGAPIVQDIIHWRKLGRLRNTFIANILAEEVDGYIHPNFSLDYVVTYRSASSLINFQNIPLRDPWMGRVIRRGFPAPKDFLMFEFDFSGQEVRVGCCEHRDRNMIAYLTEGGDMHIDASCKVFILPDKWVTKLIRQIVKGAFVFAEFYGNWYKAVAEDIWNELKIHDPVLPTGVRLLDHMKEMGIGTLEAFTDHMEEVERWLWQDRFPEYDAWKDRVWQDYLGKGYTDLLTGFRCVGEMNKKEISNYRIQGPAFHCLLYTLIQAHKKLVLGKKLRTHFIGQIHDSGVGYVHYDEMDDFFRGVNRIIEEDLMADWDWLLIPLKVEVEVGPNWHKKKVYEGWKTAMS